MARKKYRVRAKCQSCGRIWTTRAKKDAKAPRICRGKNGCGSTKTWKLEEWRVQ